MNLHCSQTKSEFEFIFLSLISLRICTTLKLVDEASGVADRLIPLRICTTLKLVCIVPSIQISLIPLRIYTTLKPPETVAPN